MIIIAHRVNKIEDLKKIPPEYGVEIDVRCKGEQLILNHEPHQEGDNLIDYLHHFHHRFIVFDIKEAGIEEEVIGIAKRAGIEDYFLLDVEYPFIYRATRKLGFRKIAIRFSEAESIEAARGHISLLDWVWIDTNTMLPLDPGSISVLRNFKTCIVCPERWGRPQDIPKYISLMKKLNYLPNAVMTNIKYAKEWEKI